MTKSQQHCGGCHNDFYNRDGNTCWSLKDAKVVTRYRLGWWTTPDTSGAFTKIKTYDCHHEPGQSAFYKKLPYFAVGTKSEVETA